LNLPAGYYAHASLLPARGGGHVEGFIRAAREAAMAAFAQSWRQI
jgi:hypothetical protein